MTTQLTTFQLGNDLYGIEVMRVQEVTGKLPVVPVPLVVFELGLVFAHAKRENAEAQARDQRSFRSNMEPLDPESRNADKSFKDPRMLKGIKRASEKDMDADVNA